MELRDYLHAIRNGRWVVLVVLGLTLAVGVAVALSQSGDYTSTSKLYVATQVESEDAGELAQRNQIAQQRVLSYVEVLNGDVVAQQISEESGEEVDPDDVAVTMIPGTVIIQITVVDADPDRAQRIATAYATAAPDVLRDLEQSDSGGYAVTAEVIDEAQEGERSEARSPVTILLLAGLLGLGAGLTVAILWWVVRRELATGAESTTA